MVTCVYSARMRYPFTAYGETALIAAQDCVICGLVLVFGLGREGRGKEMAGAFAVGMLAAVYALLGVGMERLAWMQAGAGALGVASKGPQIWTVWREGGTGQLSAFAVSLFDPSDSFFRVFGREDRN